MTFGPSDLTVVIPTHGRPDNLERTLTALAAQTVSGFDTVVVVDGADQPTPPETESRKVVVQDHAGPGAARNRGVDTTDRELVLFLGDDMVPQRDLLERHLDSHRRHAAPNDAVLGHVRWHPDLGPNPILRWMDWASVQFDYANMPSDGGDVGWGRFYSCNVSLKRKFLLDGDGGFDPAFAFYLEDLDLAIRLGRRGLRLWYEPAAVTMHRHDYDLDGLRRRYEGIARGERQLRRHHPEVEPFFAGRVEAAMARPAVSGAWARLVDRIPEGAGPLRRVVEARADTWYHQQVGPAFLAVWDGERHLDELRDYLGDDFDLDRLQRHAALTDEEEHAADSEEAFYRSSRMYLYDLTAFAMTGTKRPYFTDLARFIGPESSLLDWGCGIGADGLGLLEAGHPVAFVDFDNPSVEYLRWRLARRGLAAPVYDVERDEIPGGFRAAYSLDVVEHVDDPWGFIDQLEQRAELVMVNFLEEEPGDTHLHKPLPIGQLLDHCAARGLFHYRLYHGRSHLAIWRGTGRRRKRHFAVSQVQRRLGQRLRTSP